MRIVLAALLACCAVHPAAAGTLKLRYGQAYSSAHSIFSLPIAVAQREGLFARAGSTSRCWCPYRAAPTR